MKRRRRELVPLSRRLPLKALRSNTVSVPAQSAGNTPAHRHQSEGVTHQPTPLDPAHLIAAAAANPAVSDRAMRVYIMVAAAWDREVSAAAIATVLPSLTEAQAARLLGDLVSTGLLRKRLRTVGYKDGRRVRRGVYSLTGVTL
jgi:hypothetical protein